MRILLPCRDATWNRSSKVGSQVSLWKLVECRRMRVCADVLEAFSPNSGSQYRLAAMDSGYSGDGGRICDSESILKILSGKTGDNLRRAYSGESPEQYEPFQT